MGVATVTYPPPGGTNHDDAYRGGVYQAGPQPGSTGSTGARHARTGHPPGRPGHPADYPQTPSQPAAFGDLGPAPALPGAEIPPMGGALTPDPASDAVIRSHVVSRLRKMNVLHSHHAWRRRHRDPLGPHGLAFFYAEPPTPAHPRIELRTATRMFLAGTEAEHLPRLLYDLSHITHTHQQHNGFDPRSHLADRIEPMTRHAYYLGLGISTLDTPTTTWQQTQTRASGELDIPGRCYAYLTDTTTLLLDRGGQRDFGTFRIRSNSNLRVNGESTWPWTLDLDLHHDPATADTWHWLIHLHHTLTRAPHAR